MCECTEFTEFKQDCIEQENRAVKLAQLFVKTLKVQDKYGVKYKPIEKLFGTDRCPNCNSKLISTEVEPNRILKQCPTCDYIYAHLIRFC